MSAAFVVVIGSFLLLGWLAVVIQLIRTLLKVVNDKFEVVPFVYFPVKVLILSSAIAWACCDWLLEGQWWLHNLPTSRVGISAIVLRKGIFQPCALLGLYYMLFTRLSNVLRKESRHRSNSMGRNGSVTNMRTNQQHPGSDPASIEMESVLPKPSQQQFGGGPRSSIDSGGSGSQPQFSSSKQKMGTPTTSNSGGAGGSSFSGVGQEGSGGSKDNEKIMSSSAAGALQETTNSTSDRNSVTPSTGNTQRSSSVSKKSNSNTTTTNLPPSLVFGGGGVDQQQLETESAEGGGSIGSRSNDTSPQKPTGPSSSSMQRSASPITPPSSLQPPKFSLNLAAAVKMQQQALGQNTAMPPLAPDSGRVGGRPEAVPPPPSRNSKSVLTFASSAVARHQQYQPVGNRTPRTTHPSPRDGTTTAASPQVMGGSFDKASFPSGDQAGDLPSEAQPWFFTARKAILYRGSRWWWVSVCGIFLLFVIFAGIESKYTKERAYQCEEEHMRHFTIINIIVEEGNETNRNPLTSSPPSSTNLTTTMVENMTTPEVPPITNPPPTYGPATFSVGRIGNTSPPPSNEATTATENERHRQHDDNDRTNPPTSSASALASLPPKTTTTTTHFLTSSDNAKRNVASCITHITSTRIKYVEPMSLVILSYVTSIFYCVIWARIGYRHLQRVLHLKSKERFQRTYLIVLALLVAMFFMEFLLGLHFARVGWVHAFVCFIRQLLHMSFLIIITKCVATLNFH